MKALISPTEMVYSYDGSIIGQRVAQLTEEAFDVAAPLFWIDCSVEGSPSQYYYYEGEVLERPLPGARTDESSDAT